MALSLLNFDFQLIDGTVVYTAEFIHATLSIFAYLCSRAIKLTNIKSIKFTFMKLRLIRSKI